MTIDNKVNEVKREITKLKLRLVSEILNIYNSYINIRSKILKKKKIKKVL